MKFDIKVVGDNELIVYLEGIAGKIKPEANSGLREVGKHLQAKVKDKFGKYQAGWPKLKRASVIAKSKRRGLSGVKSTKGSSRAKAFNSVGGADDPLVLFSRLQNSIKNENKNLETVVYSNEVYAAVHEYGYRQVPSRSYMRLTLSQEEGEVVKIIMNRINKIL